jgi:hypothetical protein
MSKLEKDWAGMIERIRRSGAGTYGTPFFMARKDEHWKFLWAAERITELEAEREAASQDYADLLKGYRALREALTEIADGKHHGLDKIGSPAFARKTLEA